MASSFGFRVVLAAALLACGAATPQSGPSQGQPQQAAAKPFEVLKLEVAAEQAAPEACFVFAGRIDRSGKTPIESFVQIEPAAKIAVSVRDERVCIGGLTHGGNWKVTLLPGLPGIGGPNQPNTALAKAQSFAVQVPNRQPSVAFASRGTVLPRSAAQGLPVRTVNADKVAIQILRVRDRDVLMRLRSDSLNESVTRSELEQIDDAERVWQGELETKGEANQAKLTSLPIGETIGELKPGLYLAVATLAGAKAPAYEPLASQWFTVADIGLAAYHGSESLVVSARSLVTAQALANIEVALVAQNNRELARVRTDGEGLARFEPGLLRGTAGDSARAVFAYGDKGEFAYLDLVSGGRIDLTDRGVGGRSHAGPTEAYLYAERGIYRPGETARVTLLLRDEQARAVAKTPLTVKIRRPDDVVVDQRVVQEQAAGGATFDIALPMTARTGSWSVQAYLDPNKGEAIGKVDFLVEDFVPPRVEFELRTDAALLLPQQAAHVAIDARYLYGAPAAELAGEVAVTLKPAEQPFPAFPGYSWGLTQEETLPTALDPVTFTTDAQGKADVEVKLDRVPNTTRPLEAQLVASIFDAGGRPVDRTQTVAVANLPYALGLKATFEGSAAADQPIGFDAIAVAPDGARIDKDGLAWEVLREDVEYFWYRAGYSWDYRSSLRTTRAASGTTKIAAAASSRIETSLPPGQYRLELHDASGSIATSLRFSVGGWVVANGDSTPDKVTVVPSRPTAGTGEAIDVFIRPPYDADVVIAVADTAVRSTQLRRIGKDGANVRVELPRNSPAGAYVLATAYAPPDPKATRLPRRAIGTAWLGVDQTPRTLEVKLEAPQLWRPQQQVKLPLTVAGAGEEQVQVTVAAVDDGVLQLTEYTPPNANEFWFGKRRLGVAVTDLYSRLIDPAGALRGKVKSGGGADAINRQLTNLPKRTSKVVSLFSGIVALDKSGKAEIAFDLPDFDGRLRLMAVAWSSTKLGHADATVEVRHPVVADLTLPRFLAPDDRATLQLTLDNTDAPRGPFTAKVTAEGAVALEGDGTLSTDLAQKERRGASFTLRGNAVGDGLVKLAVTGPNGLKFDRSWPISVRPGNPTVTRKSFVQLKPGALLTVDPQLGNGLRSESAVVAASVSLLPDFDLPGVTRTLEAYPYGCAEQVVSSASPFLYARDVLQALGRPVDVNPATNPRLRDGITRSLSLQARNGAFGLWSPDDVGSGTEQVRLAAYVVDFLSRARAQGAYVPNGPFEQGLTYLASAERNVDLEDRDNRLSRNAYALYVLAREGRVDPFRVRWFADVALAKLKSPAAAAEIGAALALIGDADAAHKAFAQASGMALPADGSELRTQAELTALLAESKADAALVTAAAEKTQALVQQKRPFSTLEQAWVLRAGKALLGTQPASLKLEIDNKPVTSTGPFFAEQRGGVGKLPAIKNAGTVPLYASVAVTGVAIAPEPKESKGFDVQRQVFDRNGQPLNPAQVRQNDLLVVVLSGRFTGAGKPQPLLVDMLPAGWEIEVPDLSANGEIDRFDWLGELSSVEHTEARDDRFVAAPTIPVGEKDKKEFRVAYVVRAVTPGTFQLPGAYIEDMARPYLFGRAASATTTVVAR